MQGIPQGGHRRLNLHGCLVGWWDVSMLELLGHGSGSFVLRLVLSESFFAEVAKATTMGRAERSKRILTLAVRHMYKLGTGGLVPRISAVSLLFLLHAMCCACHHCGVSCSLGCLFLLGSPNLFLSSTQGDNWPCCLSTRPAGRSFCLAHGHSYRGGGQHGSPSGIR